MSQLTQIITATDPEIRNRSLDAFGRSASLVELLAECAALDQLRRQSDNLYERVRALFFLYAIHRFHLPLKPGLGRKGLVPFDGFNNLLKRRFEEAIEIFLAQQSVQGPNEGISSALAEAYHRLGFQTLADQERRSGRTLARELFAAHRLEPRVRMELSNNEAIKHAIIAGLGVSIMSRYALGLDVPHEQLAVLDVEGLPIDHGWQFVHHAGKQLPVVARSFMDFTLQNAQPLVFEHLSRP